MIEIRKLPDGLTPGCGIALNYFYPWEGRVPTPFGAAWARVGAGESTDGHSHHEAETFVIVAGSGVVEADGERREVETGDVVYFPPFTRHTLSNPEGRPPLDFVTLWWEDRELALGGGAAPIRRQEPRRPVVVLPVPPTPNGDLHLGHLSGPYLAADLHARYLRMRGEPAYLQFSTDDHQSWVKRRADLEESDPRTVARRYSQRMLATLEAFDIHPDVVLEPLGSPGYDEAIQRWFLSLVEGGVLERRRTPVAYCATCDRHLFEPWVSGRCPHCDMASGGNGCEECGRPNLCTDLGDARCSTCGGQPETREVDLFVLPLARWEETVRDYLGRTPMSSHLRSTAERMLADGLPDLPVTQICDWGIPVPVPGFEGQVIWAWLELAQGLRLATARLAQNEGWRVDEHGMPQPRPRVVSFLGFDNGYYLTVLFPALFAADDRGWKPLETLVGNELYRLRGEKFSTSRNHAEWGAAFAAEVPSDHARFYLCWDRPETEATSFERPDFDAVIERELVDGWGSWLAGLGARLAERFDGAAPEPGFWTAGHRAFWELLDHTLQAVASAYEAESFSPQRAVRRLSELVREARRFAADEAHRAATEATRPEERTAIALELAAARLLATAGTPVTPRLSARLWQALGLDGTAEEAGWPQRPEWVPPGSRVTLGTGPEVVSGRAGRRREPEPMDGTLYSSTAGGAGEETAAHESTETRP